MPFKADTTYDARMKKYWAAGDSIGVIADKLKIERSKATGIARRLNLFGTRARATNVRSRNGFVDLTKDDEVTRLWTVDKLSVTKIGLQVGLNRGQVSRILTRLNLFGKGAGRAEQARKRRGKATPTPWRTKPKIKKVAAPAYTRPERDEHSLPLGDHFHARIVPDAGKCRHQIGEVGEADAFWCGRPTFWNKEQKTSAWCRRCTGLIYRRIEA